MSQPENVPEFQINPRDLQDFKRDLLATVFDETYNQLLLFQHGLRRRAAKSNKNATHSKNSISTKTKKKTMPPEEVLEDIKFHQEIDALRNIFKISFESVTTDRFHEGNPYEKILKAIEDYNHTSNEAEILANELEENKTILKQLKAEKVSQANEIAEKHSQKQERLHELRDQLKKIKHINRLELNLVEKWEANRLSQAKIAAENEERSLKQQILDLKHRIAGEQRLINEVEAFRSNEISELNQQIAEWEEKFREENGKITTENSTLSKNIADLVKSREKYCEIMEQRKIFVAEYLQQKAEEQRLYEEQCYRIKCAIQIQAWWRGVMVRRGLGPYRKKSKKGKKPKGKK